MYVNMYIYVKITWIFRLHVDSHFYSVMNRKELIFLKMVTFIQHIVYLETSKDIKFIKRHVI